MELKFNRIKGVNLSSMIKKMTSMDKSVYLNIDNDNVFSSVYSPEKDVVKIVSVPLSDIFDIDDTIDKPIKMAFFEASKLTSILAYFDQPSLKGTLHFFEDSDHYYTEKITFQDNTLEIDVYCADYDLGFVCMDDNQISAAFSDIDEIFNFELSELDIAKVNNLFGLDDSELAKIIQDERGIHIKGDNYDYIVDDSKTNSIKLEVSAHKKFFSKLDKESYSVKVIKGQSQKVLLDSKNSNTNIGFNLAMGVE